MTERGVAPDTAPIVVGAGLTQHYPVRNGLFGKPQLVRALTDVDLTLHQGRTLAVVGESGCGKSTLARLVSLIEVPTTGSLSIAGTDAVASAWPGLRSLVQIVFQDPYGSLNPRHRIGTILKEPLKINRPELSSAELDERAREMLRRVGLRPEHFERYPHMFSGGQRQRIAIARALMPEPRILVLDEPVSALDVSIQSQILNLLVELQDQLGLAYLFISHDLSVVRHFTDDVIVMYQGRAMETGSKDEIFDAPRHPYTIALMSATPRADVGKRRDRIKLEGELPSPLDDLPGCAFAPRCWRVSDLCRAKRPLLTGRGHQAACHHPEG